MATDLLVAAATAVYFVALVVRQRLHSAPD